jgi:uncharacterized repeat protein (TIGR03803 family)
MPKARVHHLLFSAALATVLLVASAYGATEKVLFAFDIANGEYPYNGVIFDQAGNLYGTTFYGGSTGCAGAGCGVVFKLTPASNGDWTESTLYTFTGEADGNHPYSRLIFDKAGNLYGTTYGAYDGGAGFGTAYRLSPNQDGSWSFSLLHTFGSGSDGVQPNGPLGFDNAGNLYGVTFTGGTANLGTVFELSPESGGTYQERTVHSFIGGKDGEYPSAGVAVFGGNIFGTTESGGIGCNYVYSDGCGVIFEFSPTASGGWKESFPRRFTGGTIDGESPYALTFDSAGNLYGSAGGGTADYCDGGCGLVYRMTEKSNSVWTFTALHNFNGGDGEGPGALLFGASGSVYSEAGGGGVGVGLVFELDSTTNWSETVLYEFDGGSDGGEPVSPLTIDAAGNLYGSGIYGGNGVGVVFEVTP